jgi:hypothetical protein
VRTKSLAFAKVSCAVRSLVAQRCRKICCRSFTGGGSFGARRSCVPRSNAGGIGARGDRLGFGCGWSGWARSFQCHGLPGRQGIAVIRLVANDSRVLLLGEYEAEEFLDEHAFMGRGRGGCDRHRQTFSIDEDYDFDSLCSLIPSPPPLALETVPSTKHS